MSSTKLTLKQVHIPKKVLIAGKWWKLLPFSSKEQLKAKKGEELVYGSSCFGAKCIRYYPVLHKEEMLDTLLHEALHSILAERSGQIKLSSEEEAAVVLLSGDIMTFLKQIASVELL